MSVCTFTDSMEVKTCGLQMPGRAAFLSYNQPLVLAVLLDDLRIQDVLYSVLMTISIVIRVKYGTGTVLLYPRNFEVRGILFFFFLRDKLQH